MEGWNEAREEIWSKELLLRRKLQYCAKVMQTPVDEISQNSYLFNEFLAETKLWWPFHKFWGMYCFKRLKLSAYSLMVLMQLEIWANNSFYGANIPDENLLLLFILLKKIWLNLWFGTALCKTPMEFPAMIWVCTRPKLFATMATLSVSIVLIRLRSFTYSTFDSHLGKSFKLLFRVLE